MIGLVIQRVSLMISLTILSVRLIIRGSIPLVAAISSLIHELRRNSSAR